MKKPSGRKPFIHLTQYERDRIEHLRFCGTKAGAIAIILGRHKGTISRELAKYTNKHHRYHATNAQERAEVSRKGSKQVGMKIEQHPTLKRHIIRELKQLRSPDEIAGRMKVEERTVRVGRSAIYAWLYSVQGKEYCRYLCTRRTRKRGQSGRRKRHLIPHRVSRRYRPDDATQLHGESDLFVSPHLLRSPVVGHLTVIPDVQLLLGALLPDKTAYTMVRSMRMIGAQVPVTTWTCDNGVENVHHEQFGVPTYFCTKGSPWQKPHVENSIGLTRRWFLQKGTNLATVSQEEYQSMLFVLNHKHRKSLGYRSAYEVALERGIIAHIPKLSINLAVAFR